MIESFKPPIADVLSWLDEGTAAAIVKHGQKATPQRVIWGMMKRVFEPGYDRSPSFVRDKARWILSWVNYVTRGAKHPKRVQRAVLEVARGSKPSVVAGALGHTRTTYSDQALRLFKIRMADRIIQGIEDDFGIKPSANGVSFEFAP